LGIGETPVPMPASMTTLITTVAPSPATNPVTSRPRSTEATMIHLSFA
jgi:hypothetical protein